MPLPALDASRASGNQCAFFLKTDGMLRDGTRFVGLHTHEIWHARSGCQEVGKYWASVNAWWAAGSSILPTCTRLASSARRFGCAKLLCACVRRHAAWPWEIKPRPRMDLVYGCKCLCLPALVVTTYAKLWLAAPHWLMYLRMSGCVTGRVHVQECCVPACLQHTRSRPAVVFLHMLWCTQFSGVVARCSSSVQSMATGKHAASSAPECCCLWHVDGLASGWSHQCHTPGPHAAAG